jgi:hypothetical protein
VVGVVLDGTVLGELPAVAVAVVLLAGATDEPDVELHAVVRAAMQVSAAAAVIRRVVGGGAAIVGVLLSGMARCTM